MRSSSISVILPTYNGDRFLEETLASIAAQSLPITQLVCSDDRSNDNTTQILRAFSNKADFEVICLDHSPNGVTANYLNALRSVTGDIILVADQDDVWLNNKSQLMANALSDINVSLVSHDSLLVNHKLSPLGRTVRGNISSSASLCNNINSKSDQQNLEVYLRGNIPLLAHTLGFKSDLISALLAKPESVDQWWFEEWVSCIALTQGRLKLIEDHLVLYRQHQTQTSGGLSASKTSKFKVTSGVKKYELRIAKMEYCSTLIKNNDKYVLRYDVLNSYSKFLQARQFSISHPKPIRAYKVIIKQLLNANYWRYSKGIKSAVLDIITRINTRYN